MNTKIFRAFLLTILITVLGAAALSASDVAVPVSDDHIIYGIGTPVVDSFDSVDPYEDFEKARARRNQVLLGLGFSIGGFFPADVNGYMDNWLTTNGYTEVSGLTEMFMNFVPRVNFIYSPIEFIQFEILGEVGWGPKMFLLAGGSVDVKFFNFMRYSAAFNIQGHIPLGQYKNSIFLGAGAGFDYLVFEGYSAPNLGIRGKLGFRLNLERSAWDFFAEYLYSRKVSDPVPTATPTTLELDYSSFMIGFNYYFKLAGS